jgi:type II secretory pathway component PulF
MKLEDVTLTNSEKISLVSNLATMMTAGIPLYDAVDSLSQDAKGNQVKILETFKADLSQGKHLFITLEKFPRVFDKVTVNVIHAAEEAGTLDITLKDLKENIRKEIEFSDKIKSALIYPAFIGVVFILIFSLMLFFVIPKIATVFERLRLDLPLPTKLLISLSSLLTHNGGEVLGIGLVVTLFIVVFFRRNQSLIRQLVYSLPLVRNVIVDIDVTRFSRSMYLLLSSGIPITAALELTQDVVLKGGMKRIITDSGHMLLTGKTLSEGLRSRKGYLPVIFIKLVEAGEKTGSLDKSMQDIAEYFDYQVAQTLRTLVALLEPMMLIVVGVVVGGMMVAIIAPVYNLIGQVGGR